MTDNEIIKSLECCSKEDCGNCPAYQFGNCIDNTMEEALALINRQKAEIDRFKKRIDFLIESAYDIGRKVAVKEFAERLKETFPQDDWLRSTKRISGDIDNLVNEMVGADNA